VILLHQSPQNSRALVPWIQRLSAQYAVFAPDTPGFGYSDPLPRAQPTIPDFAAAVAALMDTLGIERAMVFGVHTGAVTALRFSLDFPSRVAGMVCDGYARFNAEERQLLLNGYLPPFEPEWNGGHLLWLWSRLREQTLFFPWNTPTKSARMAYPAPSTERLAVDVLDLLDAGDGYRAGYRAPFLYDDATAASRLNVEGKIFYRVEDVLAAHLPRLQTLPPAVTAEILHGGADELIAKTDAFFQARAGSASVVESDSAITAFVSVRRRIFSAPIGPLGALISNNGGTLNEAVVAVHLSGIGFPARIPVEVAHGTPVVAFELPGHGASRPWDASALDPTAIASPMVAALVNLGVRRITVTCEGGSAALGAALAIAARSSTIDCGRLQFINPLWLSTEEQTQFLSQLPDMTPHTAGAHLIAAWNWARMKHLFWPWHSQTAAAARKIDAPAPVRLQTEVVEIARAGQLFTPLWRAALAFDLCAALAGHSINIEILADAEDELVRFAGNLAGRLGLTMHTEEKSVAAPSHQAPGVVKWHK
jgi:pimeloyl-ACP methyl ester carboxylesterase